MYLILVHTGSYTLENLLKESKLVIRVKTKDFYMAMIPIIVNLMDKCTIAY